ncbi:hypothetical protein GT003_26355 [Paenibacillus sacheonensis]|uniref:Catalase n=1 Tax=Paenibacillus sacheonensis TaxID=742054 RepID=A0A7X4YU16_9BACL|nr:hypothetical protein [Paenibacillus sacheonensis]
MAACWRYFLYVADHKLNVLVECWREGLYLQGIVHDLSKFHPEEFVPYALKFYADRKDEQTELRWQYAWLRHQNRNKHHWEHWVVNKQTREALPMPRKYIIEMVCDWRSFSRKWGRKVKASGLLERILKSDSIILHPATRQELNDYIQSQAHASR